MNIERLVVENSGWLRVKARHYYTNPVLADDLAGETIYKILRSKDRFDGNRAFRPWALRIMANTFITDYNRRQCLPFISLDDEYVTCVCDESADQLMRLNTVWRVIAESRRRSVNIECVLLYAKGYDYEEISQMQGIPVGTVRSRISNGRRMLREELER